MFEGFGAEDCGELGEGEVVELAELERGEGWVEEVFEEVVGELGDGAGWLKTPSVAPRHLPRKPGGGEW